MVRRLGVGATAASAVVFSIILVSNLALFVGSQNRASLYLQSDAEDLLAGEADALAGSAATNLLLGAQSILAAGPIDCSTAASNLAAAIGSLRDVERSGTLTVLATSREAPDLYSPDNMSMLSPFNGSVMGELNVGLSLSVTGGVPAAGVEFARNETHLGHLPVHWDSALRDCVGALRAVAASVTAAHPSNCTADAVAPLMAAAAAGPEATSTADGFAFEFAYSIAGTDPCSVGFRVSVTQFAIQGPAGEFSVQLEGRDSASFA